MLRKIPAFASLFLVLSVPAGAQPGDDVRARLTGFSGWAAPDRPLRLSVDVTNAGTTPLEDVAVRLTFRERVRSRSALRASLDGNPSGQILAVTTEQLDKPIDPGATASVLIERDLGSLATAFRSGRAQSGVYPLGVTVLEGRRRAVERSGAIVFLASVPEARINTVWVMPIHRPLASDAHGVYDRTTLGRELLAGGRMRALADLLASRTSVPLTLAPTGQLADQLLDLSNGFVARSGRSRPESVAATDPLAVAAGELLARFRASIASPAFEIATAPYARARLGALISAGLSQDAHRQITQGQSRVAALLGRQPNPSLFADGAFGVDARSAGTFSALGAKTLILDPDSLSDRPEGRFGPDRVQDVRASNLSFDALLPDAPIRERLELRSQDPVLTTMGVVAETAAAYFELPALAAGRMVVVATSSTPDVGVAAPLVDVLSQAPWVRLRTASDAAADPELRPAGEQRRLDVGEADASARMVQARDARRIVQTLGKVLVAPSGAEELDRLDRLILASESADYDRKPATASSFAAAARDSALFRLSQISVPARRVTLTARGGQVPITVRNLTGYTIRLRVRLDSQKVTFPTGAVRTIEVPGKPEGASLGTLAFALEARAAGSFPVEVRLETPRGDEVIGSGQILVRSSAVSAVTFMATAGGALFLVGAWARRAMSRRPKRGSNA